MLEANARNVWSIVRAGRGANLVINASPAVYNEIILRAALRLRAHYLDLNSHLERSPFQPEQFRYHKKFLAKNRAALICAGAAPGLTNLLAKRGAELLDSIESVRIRLYESTESKIRFRRGRRKWLTTRRRRGRASIVTDIFFSRGALRSANDSDFRRPSARRRCIWQRRMKFACCRA